MSSENELLKREKDFLQTEAISRSEELSALRNLKAEIELKNRQLEVGRLRESESNAVRQIQFQC